jgi:hypothetical protein
VTFLLALYRYLLFDTSLIPSRRINLKRSYDVGESKNKNGKTTGIKGEREKAISLENNVNRAIASKGIC